MEHSGFSNFIVVVLHLLIPIALLGQTWSFDRIVDTDTNIPNSSDNFGGLPAFRGGAFAQERSVFIGGNQLGTFNGIYEHVSGVVSTIADYSTPVPNGTGMFNVFSDGYSGVSGSNVVFGGGYASGGGIYSRFGGQLGVVVDTNTPRPEGGLFQAILNGVSLEGQNVVFGAADSPNLANPGVYRSSAGSITRIAHTGTPIPSGTGNFTSFSGWVSRGNDVVFAGRGASGQRGIYQSVGGSLSMIYNQQTPVPSGVGAFNGFSELSVDGDDMAFWATNTVGERQGVFKRTNGVLSLVADLTTEAPSGEIFRNLGNPAISNGIVAFAGETDSAFTGIYADIDGTLQTIIRGGDTLDGVAVAEVRMFPGAFSGDKLLIYVRFIDDTEFHANQALYVVTIPVPPSMMLGAAALAGLAGRRRT